MLMQQLFNGLILGSLYALIALGYSLVYGILGLINFAHGEVVMIGAMLGLSALNLLLPLLPEAPALAVLGATLLAIAPCMLLGYGIERVAYRPLRQAPRLAPLITAIGVSILLQNLAMMVWGRQYRVFPPLFDGQTLEIAGAHLTPLQLVILLVSATLMALLWWLIQRSKIGRAMRATAQNPQVAQLMGINVNRTIALTFILGSGLAAIAGMLVSANYGQAHSYMGFMLGLKAFSAAVLGGIGSLTGAMLGGLLLGLIESLGAGYLSTLSFGVLGSQYQDIFAFLVLILVLTLRPSGLLGKSVVDRA